ncbi:MAG TPA: hypothetical protein VGO43_08265 [Pyrinomonadaceae bacterium]|jgi:hypothetical protein|nr:hypothetical protein [Pyrinomonadaceae bacterium]
MKNIPADKAIVAFKVFNPDWTCNRYQFEVGKTFEHQGTVSICSSGFHACLNLADCFSYYGFDPSNKVAEVRIWGSVDEKSDDSKLCGQFVEIVRELTWQEVLLHANSGANNTGLANSGSRNSGSRNSGSSNSGDRNSGSSNSGSRNSGSSNSGSRNSGSWNSGSRNSGSRNSGSWNSGSSNSGDSNSGSRNSGSRNSGSWNSGSRNSGDSNSGYRNSGAFCTNENPEIELFDTPSGMTVQQWEAHPAMSVLERSLETHFWIESSSMSAKDKKANPDHETTGGYLKALTLPEAWKNMWPNLDDKSKQLFLDLPNFDAAKFEQITGIKVKKVKKNA